jgi:hypothetical protein
MREAPKPGCPMAAYGAHYEPSAWRLARERIGQGLRERYPIVPDLPAGLLMPAEKLVSSESAQPMPSPWLRKLDALEGHPSLLGAGNRLLGEDLS